MSYCGRCLSYSCSCSLLANPNPYYVDAPACAEDHTQTVIQNQFHVGLSPQSEWNIPLCGGSAVLSLPGVVSIPPGSFIWNQTFGYFEVVSFDYYAQTITIQNTCLSTNAAPGTTIPKCTPFVLTVPPSAEQTQTGNFVKYDFTSPAVGDCLLITLTGTEGIVAGNIIGIGTGKYRVSSVTDGNLVTICNDGDGLVAGTPVIALNNLQQFQYPVFVESFANPCDGSDPATTGILLVCSGSEQKPLVTGSAGQVPVFTGGSGTVIAGDPSCCAINSAAITAIQAALVPCTLAAGMNVSTYEVTADGSDGFSAATPATLNGTAPSTTSFGAANFVTISNPSTCRNMTVIFDVDIEFQWILTGHGLVGSAGTINTTDQIAEIELNFSHWEGSTLGTISIPPATPTASGNIASSLISAIKNDDDSSFPTHGSYRYHRRNTFSLGPLEQIKVATRGGVNGTLVNGSPVVTPNFQTRQNFFGIAL